ncbi:MAG TPA: efflux transporter outer membrane subunit [Burkholderiaceae bacterium]|nr:efflux transporter outer membrane subunit [Burkholderiaceae bacterium]
MVLGGCAGLVPQHSGEPPAMDIPANWSSSSDGTRSGDANQPDWWRQFNDPQLTALVERALAANTDIQGALAALRQARALVTVANANLLPLVDGSASAQRNKTAATPGSSLFRAGFDASWEPDLFGANRAGLHAAKADASASVASLGDVQVSIAAEVAAAYMQWRGTRVRLDVARENLALQQETLQIAQWRAQAGLGTSLEVEQARAAAEQTSAQIPALESTLAQTASSIAVLTGRAPAALPELANAGAGDPPVAPDAIALAIPADTLRQRPDIRRAEEQVRAAAARATQADAQRFPSFTLSGNIGLSALTLGALGASSAGVAALLAGVSVPIFNGGALTARVEAQDAALQAAGAAYQGSVLIALKDVEDSLVGLRSALQRRDTLQRAVEAAGNASLIARVRYQGGVIDFQTVLDTQRTQLNTQDSLAAARTDVATAQVRLVKALGGGWNSDTVAVQTARLP